MNKFQWMLINPRGLSPEQAIWNNLRLWAYPDGRWSVSKRTGTPQRELVWKEIISHKDQTKGKDINEAKQRAQAAAIVQLQLTGVKTQ